MSARSAVRPDCDRSWLLEAHGDTWIPVMERTRPEYPGGLELGVQLPLTDGTARRHRGLLESDSAVQLNAEEIASVVVPDGVARPRAILAVAINPKVGHPWILGLHQCSCVRTWSSEEERLFVEIGHRLADALSALLAYRDLRESEQKLAQAQRVARLGYWERDVETFEVNYSEQTYRIFGLSPDLHTLEPARLAERMHPEDRHIMLEAYEQAIAGGPRYDVDYRVLLPDGVVRYVHSEADVTWDADGRPLRMFGTSAAPVTQSDGCKPWARIVLGYASTPASSPCSVSPARQGQTLPVTALAQSSSRRTSALSASSIARAGSMWPAPGVSALAAAAPSPRAIARGHGSPRSRPTRIPARTESPLPTG